MTGRIDGIYKTIFKSKDNSSLEEHIETIIELDIYSPFW